MKAGSAVIAAVDLSAISEGVVRSAAGWARRFEGRCHVIHVVEQVAELDAGPLLPALRRQLLSERRTARRALRLLVQADGIREGGDVAAELLDGSPFAVLIDRARALEAELIVVGGPPPDKALGATAERLARKSPVDLLVVRRPPVGAYSHVLVGVDFSDTSWLALRRAVPFLSPGGRLTACHVLPSRSAGLSEELIREAEVFARERMQSLIRREPLCVGLDVRIERGDARRALMAAAASAGADLLAVGSRGGSRLAQLLLGSVAEATVRGADRDVLVVAQDRSRFRLP